MMEGQYRYGTVVERPQAPYHHVEDDAGPIVSLPRPRVGASTNDQRFLLVFVLGTYFGPDIKHETPRKSALHRASLRLPSYTSHDLFRSVFKIAEIESIYYFALRHAHTSARVKLQSLYKFLHGHLAPPVKEALEDERQFPNLFPHHLHRHSRFKGTYKVVESIAFINNPDIAYIRPQDLARFRKLSGLTDLHLDAFQARNYQHGLRSDRDDDRYARFQAMAEVHRSLQEQAHDNRALGFYMGEDAKKRRKTEHVELLPPPLQTFSPLEEEKPCWLDPNEKVSTTMLLLSGPPTMERWNSIINAAKPTVVYTGTAAMRQSGPLFGAVDIGEAEDAYIFRAALPGVRRDEGEFSCHVESDGKVMIRGTTITGETQIERGSRVFNMHTQFLCPPGPFTVSFRLPGPVEACEFPSTFGSDGMFEAVVMKQRMKSVTAYLTFEP
ncbi:hypothetical protein L7F22_028280 [Adiantum nelumboides]|nr:hypothetical protein [Adiantum nelumboides]